jgi:hypothetical protein
MHDRLAMLIRCNLCLALAACGGGDERPEPAGSTSAETTAETTADGPTTTTATSGVQTASETSTIDDPTGGSTTAAEPLVVSEILPAIVDPIGRSRVVVHGGGFNNATGLTIGGVAATELVVVSDGELRAVSGPVDAGAGLDVVVLRGDDSATLTAAVDAWSPAELAGARLFDAAVGVAGEAGGSAYEWARLADEMPADWHIRDGNTVTWLPSTGKFWLIGGWNPYQEPVGFSPVPPDTEYPPRNTTNEVWSSPDGVTWTLELPHEHPQWERRHVHSTVVWRDRLWIVGGDHHQGKYNHDVLASDDGVTWTVENADPPWSHRALHIAGAYADALWMVGGQDGAGPEEDYVYHNDVWRSDDGVTWEEVVPDAPASATRWSPRGLVSQLVEFKGRMWLVGGSTYSETIPRQFHAEVWSTTDGATWTQHATPPWPGRNWNDVVVFDGRLWTMFGADDLGNHNEAWYSDDGEAWTQLPPSENGSPQSHAQGVAVGPDYVLLAGGNHTFIEGTSVWRLRAFRGEAVQAWTDRGADAVVVEAAGVEARPVLDPDALGPGVPGLQFDGFDDVLTLAGGELQPAGRSVFWVARAPWKAAPADWDTPPVVNALRTVVGDNGDSQSCAAGLAAGGVHYVSSGAEGWLSFQAGEGLAELTGAVRLAGVTQDADGAVVGWVDGAAVGEPTQLGYSQYHGWDRIGAGGYGEPDASGFAGSIGAVVVVPSALDAADVARIHAWAQGRFAAP